MRSANRFAGTPCVLLLALPLLCGYAYGNKPDPSAERSHAVTATAYTSEAAQTDATPGHGAWGDRLDDLEPGVRAIAVSQDLVARGLERHQRVRIDELDGEFVVLDRMPAQWKGRIDIHMASAEEAEEWGRRRVKISWTD
ncbi:MAG: 3D domain-containing protein [Panacagrimonas sp.]